MRPAARSGHRDGAPVGAVVFYAGLAAASRNRSGLAAASRAGPDGGEDQRGVREHRDPRLWVAAQAFTRQDFPRCVRRV
jgi:hypothetical protein